MQPEQQDSAEVLEADSVVRFLNRNPDFFNQQSDLLLRLRIPHETGGAVSLIEKQLSVLRRKTSLLESKLNELIAVARENEQLHQRLHVLFQEIISASSLDEVLALSRESLIENFHADDVKILLIDRENGELHRIQPDRFVASDEPALALFEKHFTGRATLCGVPEQPVREFLFGNQADRIGSIAVIPLHYCRNLGLAVLSSRDERRFDSNKGVMFLNQLGEVLSRRLAVLITGSSS